MGYSSAGYRGLNHAAPSRRQKKNGGELNLGGFRVSAFSIFHFSVSIGQPRLTRLTNGKRKMENGK
jgi:hypothetical protein